MGHYFLPDRASLVFPYSNKLSIIKPVYLDMEHQESRIIYAECLPFSEYICEASGDREMQLALLKQACEWQDAYRRTKMLETWVFQPKHTVYYYYELGNKVVSDVVKIAAKPWFLWVTKSWVKWQKVFWNNKPFRPFNTVTFICGISSLMVGAELGPIFQGNNPHLLAMILRIFCLVTPQS